MTESGISRIAGKAVPIDGNTGGIGATAAERRVAEGRTSVRADRFAEAAVGRRRRMELLHLPSSIPHISHPQAPLGVH